MRAVSYIILFLSCFGCLVPVSPLKAAVGPTDNAAVRVAEAAKPPLIIGLDADMSAVAVEGGQAIRRGAQIAIDEINAAGGVLGKNLELMIKDHRGNPARGKRNIQQFAALPNLVAVLGGVHTPVALAEIPLIHQNQIVYLDPWAAGTPIIDNGYSPNYVFRVSIRDAEAGKVLLAHAKSRGVNNVALLLERTGWGRSNQRSMTAAAEKLGMAVSATAWVNWRQKNMIEEIQTIARSDAQAIMLVVNAPEGVVAINEILNNEVTKVLPIVSHWGIASGSFVESLGLEALNRADLTVLQTFSFLQSDANPAITRVFEAYKEKFEPSILPESVPGAAGVAHAYDLVRLLKLAIEKAQSTEPAKIRNALEKIGEYRGLVKHYVSPFTEDWHDALMAEDYIMSTYNAQGHLVPVEVNK